MRQIGLPACLLNSLQSVLNVAARSIAGLRRSEHITDVPASFHWLRAAERIKFKVAIIVYRALHSVAPQFSYRISCSTLPIFRRNSVIASAHRLPVFSTSARRDVLLSASSRRSVVCYCRPSTLEQSTCWRPVCLVTHNISSKAENSFISGILPIHYLITASL